MSCSKMVLVGMSYRKAASGTLRVGEHQTGEQKARVGVGKSCGVVDSGNVCYPREDILW